MSLNTDVTILFNSINTNTTIFNNDYFDYLSEINTLIFNQNLSETDTESFVKCLKKAIEENNFTDVNLLINAATNSIKENGDCNKIFEECTRLFELSYLVDLCEKDRTLFNKIIDYENKIREYLNKPGDSLFDRYYAEKNLSEADFYRYLCKINYQIDAYGFQLLYKNEPDIEALRYLFSQFIFSLPLLPDKELKLVADLGALKTCLQFSNEEKHLVEHEQILWALYRILSLDNYFFLKQLSNTDLSIVIQAHHKCSNNVSVGVALDKMSDEILKGKSLGLKLVAEYLSFLCENLEEKENLKKLQFIFKKLIISNKCEIVKFFELKKQKNIDDDFNEIIRIFKICSKYIDLGELVSEVNAYISLEKDLIQCLINYGVPLTKEIIATAFFEQNYEFIEFLLKNADENFLKDKEVIAAILSQVALFDETICQLIIQYVPYVKAHFNSNHLMDAINRNFPISALWMIKNAEEEMIKNQNQWESCIETALEKGNLKLIKCIHAIGYDKGWTKKSWIEWLKIKEKNGGLDKKAVFHFALHSEMSEIFDLLLENQTYFDELLNYLPKLQSLMALLVRFPCTNSDEMKNIILSSHEEDYSNISQTYALINLNFIKSNVGKLPRLSHVKLTDGITMNRGMNLLNRKDCEDYQKRRNSFEEKIFRTPIEAERAKFITRYTYALKYLNLLFNNDSNKLSYAINSLSSNKKKKIGNSVYNSIIDFTYKLEETTYTLTSFAYQEISSGDKRVEERKIRFFWVHTRNVLLRIMENRMAELHRQLVQYDLDIEDADNYKNFQNLVAEGYWLKSTLCEFLRGTPHNAMMWLNMIYKYHKLGFPIPKRKYFFLDNVMLMLPKELAIDLWPTFFEPYFGEHIKFENAEKKFNYYAVHLAKNGLMLELCPLDIRCDEQLVAIAYNHNKESLIFASPRIQKKLCSML